MKKINGIKKGLIYALVTAMLTSGTVGMMPLSVSAATTGRVNTSALNVRSGAGTGYARVGSVTQGQTVTIVDSVKADDGYTWYKISGTTSGYVRGDYISNIVSDNVASKTGIITADWLNVRTGAGTNYSRMGSVAYGTRLTIISTHGNWYKVTCKIDNKIRTGYVSADYVNLDTGSGSNSSGNSSSGSSTNSGTTTESVIATGVVNVSALNVRSGAGTSYSVITVLGNKANVDILSQSGSWYKVRITVSGSQKTGYVHSDYITKTATSNNSTTQVSGQGVVNVSALNVRSGAGTSHSVLHVLYSNEKVEIVSQIGNWYSIKYTDGGVKTGYVAAEYITKIATPQTPQEPETESKAPETESKEPETESKAPEPETPTPIEPEAPAYTPKNGVVTVDELRVRSKAGTDGAIYGFVNKGTKVTIIGEEGDWYKVRVVLNGTTKEAYLSKQYVTIQEDHGNSGNSGNTGSHPSTGNKAGTVTGNGVYVRKGPGTSYGKLGQLSLGTLVTILGKEGDWYKVTCVVNGTLKEGYIYSQWVRELGADDSDFTGDKDESFEEQIASFPESYKNALCRLHEKYPKWNFVAHHTGMDFEDAIEAQNDGKLSMIYFKEGTTPFSWLSTKSEDYDWATDTYVNRDGTTWKSASKEILAYYMDPRNFLDDQQIFMFETMAYDESQSREVVAGILYGCFMQDGNGYNYNGKRYTYVDTFMEAGEIAGVSPYILASRSRQEVGGGGNTNATGNGNYITGQKVYNYFNIGAYASANGDAVANGLSYASQTGSWRRPWTSQWLAIVGGAEFLASEYINRGQNTDYFQKFNVVSQPYHQHQYMGNIQAPCSEGLSRYGSYNDLGMLNGEFTFIIPVYNNMPATAAAMPTETGNPNAYLKSLTVSGMNLNQTFTYNTSNYNGVTNQSAITISATPVSKYATIVSGTGTHTLNLGTNQITVVCEAGNGDRFTYTLNIYRQ